MKKLLALLAACTTMTCAFASCGDEEKESSVSKEASVSDESSGETTAESADGTEESSTEAESEEEAESESEESQEETEPETEEDTGESDQPSFIGKWKGEKAVVDGEEVNSIDGIPAYVFQVDFKEDGTLLFGDIMTELVEESNYTWSMVSDTEIEAVNDDGADALFVIEDDYLVSIEGDDKIYLSKVDEFTAFGDADLSAFLGKWEGEKIVEDGEEVTEDDVPAYVYQFDFKENGKVEIGEYMTGFIDGTMCFWNLLSENQIEMICDGDVITLTVDGDYLVATGEYTDEKIYFVRVDEFKPVSEFIS